MIKRGLFTFLLFVQISSVNSAQTKLKHLKKSRRHRQFYKKDEVSISGNKHDLNWFYLQFDHRKGNFMVC